MNNIVKILMERDGITQQEAENLIGDVKEMMEDCNYDAFECEDIFMNFLGLELDYLPEIL